jgi:hypothetical protein
MFKIELHESTKQYIKYVLNEAKGPPVDLDKSENKKRAPSNPSQMDYEEYKKNIQKSIGGQATRDATNSRIRGGFGAPLMPGENYQDRTGSGPVKQGDLLYNYTSLFGRSLPNLPGGTDDATKMAAILEPYKDLQRIKLQKSLTPDIALKAQGIIGVESAHLNQAGSASTGSGVAQPYKAVTGNAKNAAEKRKELEDAGMVAAGSGPGGIKPISDVDIEAFYDKAHQANQDAIKSAKQQSQPQTNQPNAASNTFMSKVKRHAMALQGLGGLDPYFGRELAAKLLGGEWIEKMTQNIAPSQEAGVISSMGSKSALRGY